MKSFVLRSLLIVIVAASMLTSCSQYKEVTIGEDVLLSHKIWKKNYDKYVYLVHSDSSVRQLRHVSIKLDSSDESVTEITGLLGSVDSSLTDFTNKKLSKKEARKVIHLILKDDNPIDLDATGDSTRIREQDIAKVRMHTKKNRGALGIILTVLGIIAGILLLMLIILLVALLSASGNGSNSNSNSDPQCYIATMAYGSSEAPQVMVLRNFRDKFLMRFAAGKHFVSWYYANSPGFVSRHKNKEWLHTVARSVLNFVVTILKIKY